MRFVLFCIFLFIPSLVLGQDTQLLVTLPKEFPVCTMSHITDGLVASDGSIWVVGEGGVNKLGSEKSYFGPWVDARYFPGFPNTENFYAVAQDLQGRIWVGTDNKGVAVFNGDKWQSYTYDNTLPGERVFDIAVSPVDGEVAIATSGGVALYNPRNDSWRDLNRANGLVSDQVESLCYDQEGKLWLAYACGGIASGSSKTNYEKWDTIQAPWYWDAKQYVRQPLMPKGSGLPSNLCNVILEGKNGTVWLGTNCGLAYRQAGRSWQFVRGSDFEEKNKGVYQSGKSLNTGSSGKEILPEDYITALTKSDTGVWVGMREKGICQWSVNRGSYDILKLSDRQRGKEITSLFAFPDGSLGATSYGGGCFLAHRGKGTWEKANGTGSKASFPSYPKLLSPEKIVEMITVEKVKQPLPSVIFSHEDWSTRGDWCGRYGNVYALLCAANAPYASCIYVSDLAYGKKKVQINEMFYQLLKEYKVTGFMGMHREPDDALRSWVHWVTANDNENVLYCPTDAVRTEAEWDDHGEAYPKSFDGPDIWVRLLIPEGLNRVDLYFFNPNGREPEANQRDYLVEVRQGVSPYDNFEGVQITKVSEYKEMEKRIAELCQLPVLARTRVNKFAGSGVYKSFLVQKGGMYWIRVGRNNSFNAILNGVFISKVIPPGKMNQEDWKPVISTEFSQIAPLPPDLKKEKMREKEIAFFKAWEVSQENGFSTAAVASVSRKGLLEQYRKLSVQTQDDSGLSSRLQWELNLWPEGERRKFDNTMVTSWNRKQETMPDYRSKEFMPHAPGTIPFSIMECRQMAELGIDWKQYRLGAYPAPKLSVKEMKEFLQKQQSTDSKTKK